MRVQDIPTKEISDDFFFCFRSGRDSTLLMDSIRSGGICTPLRLVRRGEAYRMLSGFRRLAAAREIGLRTVPGIVHAEEQNTTALFRDVLLENRSQGSFTLVEKARVLRILDGLGIDPERVRSDFLPILGVADQGHVLRDLRRVLDFSPAAQAYIEAYDVSLKQSDMFDGLTTKDQEAVLTALDALHVRSVELGTIVEMLRDISGREMLSMEEILRSDSVRSVLEGGLSRNETLSRLKTVLFARQYPRLYGWNEDLKTLGKRLRFPEWVRFGWDRSLERPGMEMRVRLRSLRDVDEAVERLMDAKNRESLEAMFRVVS